MSAACTLSGWRRTASLRGREHGIVALQPLLGQRQQQPRLGQLGLLRQQSKGRAPRLRQAPGLDVPLRLAEQRVGRWR